MFMFIKDQRLEYPAGGTRNLPVAAGRLVESIIIKVRAETTRNEIIIVSIMHYMHVKS
jgi:hypothetical protein